MDLGPVSLTVTSLPRALSFYRDLLGLRADAAGGTALLAAGGTPLLRLTEEPGLLAPSLGAGLFHVAFLLPSRRDLAAALLGLERAGWPLQGASDHRVSEALYLADPDGHGLEIYADRPREAWARAGAELVMTTEPLDIPDLLRELGGAPGRWAGLPSGTTVGHVHLRVTDLDRAERFFAGVLGLEVTVRGYAGARFFAAGGYHHHVGANVWWRRNAGGDPAGRVRLVDVGVHVAPDELHAIAERSGAAVAGGALRLAGPDDGYTVTVTA